VTIYLFINYMNIELAPQYAIIDFLLVIVYLICTINSTTQLIQFYAICCGLPQISLLHLETKYTNNVVGLKGP
jgi:hypothetical protein